MFGPSRCILAKLISSPPGCAPCCLAALLFSCSSLSAAGRPPPPSHIQFDGQAGSLSHGRAVATDLQVCQSKTGRLWIDWNFRSSCRWITTSFYRQAESLSHGRAVVTDLQVCQSKTGRLWIDWNFRSSCRWITTSFSQTGWKPIPRQDLIQNGSVTRETSSRGVVEGFNNKASRTLFPTFGFWGLRSRQHWFVTFIRKPGPAGMGPWIRHSRPLSEDLRFPGHLIESDRARRYLGPKRWTVCVPA